MIDKILTLFPVQVSHPLLCHKLLSAVTVVTIISIHGIILPSLYNNLPQPMHTSQLSGQEYMDGVLNCDNTTRCQEGFRMRPEVFRFLCSTLSCSAWQMAVWWNGRLGL